MRRLHLWAGLAVLAVVVGLSLWLILRPNWAARLVHDEVQASLGRELTVAGGAHFELFPNLAIRLDDATLASPAGFETSFARAGSVRLPIGFTTIFTHRLDTSRVELDGANIALVVDGMGRTSWPSTAPAQPVAKTLYLNNSSIHVLDERSGQSFTMDKANFAVSFSSAGELSLSGTAIVNGQLVNLDAYVKDLTRLAASGSPAELALEAAPLSLSFNGRLTTTGAIGLAGTVQASGRDLRAALDWTGSAPGGTMGLKAFDLSGGLDAQGRAFAVHGASLDLDGMTAKGDLSLDYRGRVAKLQAVMEAEEIALDQYIPATGWSDGDWGRARLSFSALRGLDAAVTLTTGNIAYGGLATGPARIAATITGGRLDAKIVSQAIPELSLTFDGSSRLPGFAAGLKAPSLDSARVLAPLLGIAWLSGSGPVSLSLSAVGTTQQEMVSNLRGEATIGLLNGEVRGLDTVKALDAVSREIQEGWPGDGSGSTAFDSLAAHFTVADGIASMTALKVNNPSLSMTATGDIDLLRRAVDLRADPRLVAAKPGEVEGLPVAIVVRGPWNAPRLYPDMADIVSNPKAAYEALKALGLPSASTGTGN